MTWAAVAILAYVTIERLLELWLSRRNTADLLAKGGREAAAGHYRWIVAVHVLWLLSLWIFAPGRTIESFWLALYVLLQFARLWVLATLGPRWSARIVVLPDEPLVTSGPYRFLRHPNYWVVIGEIAVLPLVFGLWAIALIFTILNAAVLWVRIREENRALGR